MAVAYVQYQYCFRSDTGGVNSAATFPVALNTTWFPGWVGFRLRFTIQTTGSSGTAAAAVHDLYVSRNSGAYALIGAGTGVLANAAGNVTDADLAYVSSAQLAAGTGTFLAGSSGLGGQWCKSTTGSGSQAVTRGDYTEFEYGLILDPTVLNTGDTLKFEVYHATAAMTTYTQIPLITVGVKPSPTRRPVRNLFFR